MSRKKANWYQQTESLLYNYKSFKIRIMSLGQQTDMLREQLMPRTVPVYELKEGTDYSVSSPVEKAVIERMEGETIQKLERKIKNLEAIQKIVEIAVNNMLDTEQKQLVDLIYNRQLTWQQICRDMLIDKNTYYQRKNEIVKVLAWCFGYLPDQDAGEAMGFLVNQARCENSGNN